MSLFKPRISIAIFLLSALLAWRGFTLLMLPPIYQLARQSLLLHYEGHLLILLAVVMAISHRWIIVKLVWVFQEIHRIVSALLMASVIGIDAMMHAFSIPHMEGWWLPLLGGASASGISALIRSWVSRTRHDSPKC